MNELIFRGCQSVQVVVTPADLREFALAIIAEFREDSKKEEQLFTPDEFAARHHVTKGTLWRWEKSGILHPIRHGRKVFYKDSDLTVKEG